MAAEGTGDRIFVNSVGENSLSNRRGRPASPIRCFRRRISSKIDNILSSLLHFVKSATKHSSPGETYGGRPEQDGGSLLRFSKAQFQRALFTTYPSIDSWQGILPQPLIVEKWCSVLA